MASEADDQAKVIAPYLLNQSDVPVLQKSYEKVTEWDGVAGTGDAARRVAATSVTQRWWRSGTRTELLVEAAVFANQDDALLVAGSRASNLKSVEAMQDKMPKDGILPAPTNGDKVWGLYDPPELTGDREGSHCQTISPISRVGTIVFVKENVAVCVVSHSIGNLMGSKWCVWHSRCGWFLQEKPFDSIITSEET